MFDSADALSACNKMLIHTAFSSVPGWPYADWASGSCFSASTREQLVGAVDAWCTDSAAALSSYGPMDFWDVSGVTDTSELGMRLDKKLLRVRAPVGSLPHEFLERAALQSHSPLDSSENTSVNIECKAHLTS